MHRTRKTPTRFTPTQRRRLLPRIEHALGATSVGDMERLAGVSRDNSEATDLYLSARRRLLESGVDADANPLTVIDEAMAECRRRIAQRTAWVTL